MPKQTDHEGRGVMKRQSTRVFVTSLVLAMTMGTVSAAAAQTTAGTDAKAGTAVAEQPENAGDAKVSAKDAGTSSKASESADSKLAKAPKSSADTNFKAPAEPWEPAWGADVDCATCHADVETDHKKFGVTSHIEAGLTCVDCHNSEELGAFHGGDAEAKVAYTDEFCLDCHIEGNPHPSWEALAELTQDSCPPPGGLDRRAAYLRHVPHHARQERRRLRLLRLSPFLHPAGLCRLPRQEQGVGESGLRSSAAQTPSCSRGHRRAVRSRKESFYLRRPCAAE